ncbi:MAG: class I SAM-dependent methyltransferase [Chloroflexia bacterium]
MADSRAPSPEKMVAGLYGTAAPGVRAYVRLRPWILPFEAIDRSVPQRGLILDVGCGYGVLANWLALSARERFVVGIDRDVKRIVVAQRTVGNRTNIAFLVADALRVPLEAWDGIVLTDFLHHLPRPEQDRFLVEVHRRLRPCGVLAIREVGERPRWKHLMSRLADGVLYPGDRIAYRRPSELIAFLEGLGFAVEWQPDHPGRPFCTYLYICRLRDRDTAPTP